MSNMLSRLVPALPFIALYSTLYAGFGSESPFLPEFFASRDLTPQAIGLILGLGTAVRLATGPAAGWLADRLDARRAVLAGCIAAAGLLGLGYLPAGGFVPMLLVSLASAALLAPLAPLSDAITLAAASVGPQEETPRGFEYGWVRGAGSAAFICGSLLAGQMIDGFGLSIIVWLNAALLVVAAVWAARLPSPRNSTPIGPTATRARSREDLLALLRLPVFRRIALIAAMIQGSHALHDSFAVIRWRAAGVGSGTISVLWSESVAAEVVVFFFLGRPLLNALGPAGACALAAVAGVVRWGVLAQTAAVPAAALVEPLHGLTFALQHLASMRLIVEVVPARLAATAQALYGTVAIGSTSALLTLGSGTLYQSFGAEAFWFMGALCVVALPLTLGLRQPRG